MQEEVLRIKHLAFGYTKEQLLYRDLSLSLRIGELKAIVAPSGAGKSTLFELILGNLKPQRGSIVVTPHISEVFQDPYSSFHPSYTIIDQIADVAALDELEHYLGSLGIQRELLKSYPHALSGGQLQRCSILRAMLMRPKLLLLDEPTSALDNLLQLSTMQMILRHLEHLAILLITHDQALAHWCADEIITL